MDLKDILSISGHPGLYRFISQGRNAIIVENLEDKKRMSAFGSDKVSSLEDIALFTDGEDIPLVEVFRAIHAKEGGEAAIDPKSAPETLREYFGEVVPSYDRDRVYISDMKKILLWYNLLVSLNMVSFEEEKKKEKSAEAAKEEALAEEMTKAGPKSKPRPKPKPKPKPKPGK